MTSDEVILRAQLGVRTLLARGMAVRAISWTSSLLLVVLVRPDQFGLLAVIRGTLGLVGFLGELGFVGTMVRRAEPPSDRELAALTGLRFTVFLAVFWLVVFAPNVLSPIGLAAPEWHGWVVAMFGSLLVTPWQLASRIQLERNLEFRKLAAVEVALLGLQSLGLVLAAIGGSFDVGIFVVMIASSGLGTLLFNRLVPGSAISFDLRPLKSLLRQTAGFSVSSLFGVLRENLLPLVVASMFGLAAAGIWAFALRIGQLHFLVFEAYWRSGFPAAARIASDSAALRRMSLTALADVASISYPLAGVLFCAAPLIALVLPDWASSVGQVQIYVLSLGFAGVYSAALAPAAIALRGATGAVLEQALSTAAIVVVLVILKLAATPTVAFAYAAGNLTSAFLWIAIWESSGRLGLLTPVVRPLLALVAVVGAYLALRHVGSDQLAALAGCVASIILVMPERRRLLRVFTGRGAAGLSASQEIT